MPALSEIVAGAMALVAAIMRAFVDVDSSSGGTCNITTFNATLKPCGTALVDSLIQLIYSGVDLLANLVGALAVTQTGIT